jgi:tight adherence protein C
MNEWILITLVGLGSAALSFVIYVLMRPRQRPLDERLQRSSPKGDEVKRELVLGPLTTGLSAQVPMSRAAKSEIQVELRSAGFYQPTALTEYRAVRSVLVVLPLLLALVVAMLSEPTQMVPVLTAGLIGAVLGFSLPRVYVALRGRYRSRQVSRGIPLAIDLLTLCLSSGQNLLTALRQVAHELRFSHPVLAQELTITYQQAELHSLEHAFKQLADRVRVPEVNNLALLLIQSEKLGTDTTTTLLEMATNFRTTTRQRVEAQANRASFWMLFPSVFCFWIAAAIILIGPAYIEFSTFRQRQAQYLNQSRHNIDLANQRPDANNAPAGNPVAP